MPLPKLTPQEERDLQEASGVSAPDPLLATASSVPSGMSSQDAKDLLEAGGDANYTPPPPPREIRGLLGHLGWGIGEKIEKARAATLNPVADVIRKNPLAEVRSGQTKSVLANVIMGLPTLPGAVVNEFAAQNVEQLPETLGLMGAGAIGKATGAFAKLGKGVKALDTGWEAKGILPSFQGLANATRGHFTLAYRGGHSNAGSAILEAMDKGNVTAQNLASDVKAMLLGSPERPFTIEEQQYIRQLMQQPGQRAIAAKAATATPELADAMARVARDTVGIPGSGAEAAARPFIQSDLPPSHFANVANVAEHQLQQTWVRLSKVLGQDPEAASRFFADAGYDPIMYAGNRTGVWAGGGGRIRESSVKGFLMKRGEQSAEDRITKGLITEPATPVSMRIAQEQRLANVREAFNSFSADPNLVLPLPGNIATGIDASTLQEYYRLNMATEAGKTVQVPGLGWFKKMPTDVGLGPLSGRLVRAPEAHEIDMMTRSSGTIMKTVRKWWSTWKFGKTVMNPATQVKNFTSNIMQAHAEGLSPYRVDIYSKALRELKHGGAWWDEARRMGAEWTNLRGSSLDDVMDERTLKDANSAYEAFMTRLPNWLMKNKGSAKMAEAYAQSESLFKHAVYIYLRRNGVNAEEAMGRASAAILDYNKMPQWVKWARSSPVGVPFISFTYGVTPRVAKAVLEKPQLFLHYKIAMDSWNTVAKESAGITDQEQADISAAFPGTIPMVMPYRGETGSPLVFDVARYTPMSAVPGVMPDRLDMSGAPGVGGALKGAVGGAVGSVLGTNPILQLLSTLNTGVDPYFKREVIPQEVPGSNTGAAILGLQNNPELMKRLFGDMEDKRISATASAVGRSTLPPLVASSLPGGYINSAVRGKENFLGGKTSVGSALLQELYGKTLPLDQQKISKLLALKKQATKARGVARSNAR